MDTATADPNYQPLGATIMENNQIQTIVTTFAKAHKIGKLKVETFALELLSAARAATGAPRGKPASENTLQLRKLTLDAVSSGYRTSGDIIKHLNLQQAKDAAVHVNNALTYWHKQGKLTIAGKDQSHTGKGKKPNVWTVKC